MKFFFKQILKYYLKSITKLVLFIHKPVVVAVAGSTNKTFVRDEIAKMLKEKGKNVRANPKSFNTEIGLPLAVLNLPSGYNSYKNWLPAIYQSLFCVFWKNFPEFLVLELGVSKKGDMKYLLSIVKPKVSVITDITQRYLENFSGMDDLAGEYKYLAKNTKSGGMIVLNFDNKRVKEIAKLASRSTRVVFLGIDKAAEWKIENIQRKETGEIFELENKNEIINCDTRRFGKHHIYAKAFGIITNKYFDGII